MSTTQSQSHRKNELATEIFLPDCHNHPLVRKPLTVPYSCNRCGQQGIGIGYQCKENCNFYVHKACINPKTYIKLDKCKYKHYERNPGSSRVCQACRKKVNGFEYECTSTHLLEGKFKDPHFLHPVCAIVANQRPSIKINGVELNFTRKLLSECKNCQRSGSKEGTKGWGYVSTCGQYNFHMACVMEMIDEASQNKTVKATGTSSSTLDNTVPGTSREMEGRLNLKDASKIIGIRFLERVISAILGDPTTDLERESIKVISKFIIEELFEIVSG